MESESTLTEYFGANGKYLDEWLNSKGQRHRKDGPAYIYYNNNGMITIEIWYWNGMEHRLDGPAEIYYNNGLITDQYWYINGTEIEAPEKTERQERERQVMENARKARERQARQARERQARQRQVRQARQRQVRQARQAMKQEWGRQASDDDDDDDDERQDRQARERQAQARERQERIKRATSDWVLMNRSNIKPLPKIDKAFINDLQSEFCQPTNILGLNPFTKVENFQIVNGELFYMGLPTTINVGDVIGSGFYGVVNSATLVVHNNDQSTQSFQCAIKRSKYGQLDDVIAHRLFPEALACDGIISYIPLNDETILMPLATGCLHDKIEKISLQKGCQITLIVAEQMMCMLEHGVIYYDLAPRNVLYFCNQDGITISLADIGSVIPTGNEHLSTLKLRQHKDYDTISTNYTMILINFIYMLVRGLSIDYSNIKSFYANIRECDENGPISKLLSESFTIAPPVETFVAALNEKVKHSSQ